MVMLKCNVIHARSILTCETKPTDEQKVAPVMSRINYIIVTGPAKISHVNANYTKLYFANIFSSECDMPFL